MKIPPSSDISQAQLATPLNPHRAKYLFRSLLPILASYWQEASYGRAGDSAWTEYVTLLRACQQILDHAPLHPNEAAQVNAERRLERALEVLATALHTILPTSLQELDYYIMDDAALERRQETGVKHVKWAKRQRNQRDTQQ